MGTATGDLCTHDSRPRLRLIHIFAFTTLAAVLLAIDLTDKRGILPHNDLLPVGMIFRSIASAICATGAVVLWSHRRADRETPLEAGHALVVLCLLELGVSYVNELFAQRFQTNEFLAQVVIRNFDIARVAVAWWLDRRLGATKTWKLGYRLYWLSLAPFALMTIYADWSLIALRRYARGNPPMEIFSFVSCVLLYASALIFATAVIRDLRQGVRRDWIHWSGVWITLVPAILLEVLLVFRSLV